MVSGVASNYDMASLVIGQVIVVFALLLAIVGLSQLRVKSSTSLGIFTGISILYAAMSFASSYVEEEQHFWYWTSATWLSMLWIKGSVHFKLDQDPWTKAL